MSYKENPELMFIAIFFLERLVIIEIVILQKIPLDWWAHQISYSALFQWA